MLGNKLKRIFGFAFGRSAPTNSSLWSDGSLDSRVFELRIFWLKSQLCCLTGETLMLRGKIKALTWHESFIRFNHTQKSFVHDSFFSVLFMSKGWEKKRKRKAYRKSLFFIFPIAEETLFNFSSTAERTCKKTTKSFCAFGFRHWRRFIVENVEI